LVDTFLSIYVVHVMRKPDMLEMISGNGILFEMLAILRRKYILVIRWTKHRNQNSLHS